MMTPAEEAECVNAEPLPELDPVRLAIQVELPSASEKQKLTHATDNDEVKPACAKPQFKLSGQAVSGFVTAFAAVVVMALLSVVVLFGRLSEVNRWSSLMERAGFVDWSMRGLSLLILTATIPILAAGVAVPIFLKWNYGHRPFGLPVLRVLQHLILLTAIASSVSFLLLIFGWNGSQGVSEDVIKRLAVQTTAVTNFNQGYCQAWCRHTDAGLAAFMRGDCGPDTTTPFDAIATLFEIGDWCKQAIAKQNFELVATYDGVSPFASLKGQGGGLLMTMLWSNMLSVWNGLIGLSLYPSWIEVRKHLPNGPDL